MPISRQARAIRTAISPRLAMRILRNMFFKRLTASRILAQQENRTFEVTKAAEFRGHGKFFELDNHLLLYDVGRRRYCPWMGCSRPSAVHPPCREGNPAPKYGARVGAVSSHRTQIWIVI